MTDERHVVKISWRLTDSLLWGQGAGGSGGSGPRVEWYKCSCGKWIRATRWEQHQCKAKEEAIQ